MMLQELVIELYHSEAEMMQAILKELREKDSTLFSWWKNKMPDNAWEFHITTTDLKFFFMLGKTLGKNIEMKKLPV